jgi:hypothetical protein
MKNGYIPKEQRKKILLITDDIRLPSGVGNIGREIVLNSCHVYNFCCIGGAMNHPEKGKRLDLSGDTANHSGVEDANVSLYPTDGYGNPQILRQIMSIEKPDVILLITDPRYFVWLFQMENEIRKQIPIAYLNIWDDLPAPYYNLPFYKSCDLLMAISKQTKNINKMVLDIDNIPYIDLDTAKNTKKSHNKLIKYVPHGLSTKDFYPIGESHPEFKDLNVFRNNLLGGKDFEFVLLFNSRNIRRKQIPDTMMAFRLFTDSLPKDKAKKCALVLHTQVIDDNGTDLLAVKELLETEYTNFIFSEQRLDNKNMNYLYNSTDATILLTNNEGWGLSLTETLLVGNPIIANVTGGMQDQMRFSKNGKWIDFNKDFPSNHRGTIKEHAPWAFPVYPSNISIQGSVPTPYIYDDRCRPEDAAKNIEKLYELSKEERKKIGKLGYEWATGDEAGFTAEKMSERIILALDSLFECWVPRENYTIMKVENKNKKTLNHKLLY